VKNWFHQNLRFKWVNLYRYTAGDVFDEVLVDDVDAGDQFERAYAPWPFRFFGVRPGGSLELVPLAAGCTYDLRQLRDWVLQL
jgi:hypothetical protein